MSSTSTNGYQKMPVESKNLGRVNQSGHSSTSGKVLAWDGVMFSKTTRQINSHTSGKPKNSNPAKTKTLPLTKINGSGFAGGMEFKAFPTQTIAPSSPDEQTFKHENRTVLPRFESGENINTSKAIEGIKVPVAPELSIGPQVAIRHTPPHDWQLPVHELGENQNIDIGRNELQDKKHTFANLTTSLRDYGNELLNGLGLNKHSDSRLATNRTESSENSFDQQEEKISKNELFDLTFYHDHDNGISSTIFPMADKDRIYTQNSIYEENSATVSVPNDVADSETIIHNPTNVSASSSDFPSTHSLQGQNKGSAITTGQGINRHTLSNLQTSDYEVSPINLSTIDNQTSKDSLSQNQAYLFKQNSALHRSIPTQNAEKTKFIPFVGQSRRKRLRPIPSKSKLNVLENLETYWNRAAKNLAGSRGGAILTALGPILFSRVFAVGLVSMLVLVFMGNLWMSTRATNQSSQASQEQQQVVVPPTSRGNNFGPQVPIVNPENSSNGISAPDPFFDAPGFNSSQEASSRISSQRSPTR